MTTQTRRSRIMPAMTLWQPWASLVALGLKPYETRDRRPPHRLLGQRIAIHAALRRPAFGDVTPDIHEAMVRATDNLTWFDLLPYGAVVCTATLQDVWPGGAVQADPFGDYGPGRWAWHLIDIHPLRPPVPATGSRLYGWTWAVPDRVDVYPPAVRPSLFREAADGC